MNTASKIVSLAIASNGRKFQRTTKLGRFKFAFIHINNEGNGNANFFETQQEAVAKMEFFRANFVKSQATWASYVKRSTLEEQITEVVPVTVG